MLQNFNHVIQGDNVEITRANIHSTSMRFVNIKKFKVGDEIIVKDTYCNVDEYPNFINKIGNILHIGESGLAVIEFNDNIKMSMYLARLEHYQHSVIMF